MSLKDDERWIREALAVTTARGKQILLVHHRTQQYHWSEHWDHVGAPGCAPHDGGIGIRRFLNSLVGSFEQCSDLADKCLITSRQLHSW